MLVKPPTSIFSELSNGRFDGGGLLSDLITSAMWPNREKRFTPCQNFPTEGGQQKISHRVGGILLNFPNRLSYIELPRILLKKRKEREKKDQHKEISANKQLQKYIDV